MRWNRLFRRGANLFRYTNVTRRAAKMRMHQCVQQLVYSAVSKQKKKKKNPRHTCQQFLPMEMQSGWQQPLLLSYKRPKSRLDPCGSDPTQRTPWEYKAERERLYSSSNTSLRLIICQESPSWREKKGKKLKMSLKSCVIVSRSDLAEGLNTIYDKYCACLSAPVHPTTTTGKQPFCLCMYAFSSDTYILNKDLLRSHENGVFLLCFFASRNTLQL